MAGVILVVVVSAWAGKALAATGDDGQGIYKPASGTNTFDATIKNTGTTNHLYDYVAVPSGNSVTACSITGGFPTGSTCMVNGAGPGTAEVAIASPGLAPGATGAFSFTTTDPVCTESPPTCPDLPGAVNSTSNPNSYTAITFKPAACPEITLSPEKLQDGVVGVPYGFYRHGGYVSATGGTPGYLFDTDRSKIPPGMDFVSQGQPNAGIAQGTPTAPGTYTFTVTAQDQTPASEGGPCTGSREYTIVVHCGGITVSGNDHPTWTVGRDVQDQHSATGGTPPYTWSLIPFQGDFFNGKGIDPGGKGVPGVGIDQKGKVQGIPRQEAYLKLLRIQVVDANGCVGYRDELVTIAPAVKADLGKLSPTTAAIQLLIQENLSGTQGVSSTPAATSTANDLRYRRKPLGGHFGSYASIFKNKTTTKLTFTAKRGSVYCFSAEPTAAKGAGWGHETCNKVPK